MGRPRNKNQNGFTLVEISIVMIIIGLLIGGTFGGLKLVENMQINKTVQDLKAIESAALTFKDTYGRLPGDITTPSTRLPSCTAVPCSTAGNGDRRIGTINTAGSAITDTNEKFIFWHHLQAANLLSMDYRNTIDMNFGEGQPTSPQGGGYRVTGYVTGWWAQPTYAAHQIMITPVANTAITGAATDNDIGCRTIRAIDSKMDDDRPTIGRFVSRDCAGGGGRDDPTADWGNVDNISFAVHFFKF